MQCFTHVCYSELFTIIVDMLAILIHGSLAGELSEKGEENKKFYQSLIRKLKVPDWLFSEHFVMHKCLFLIEFFYVIISCIR